ncbi:AI-2E family transporter [Candidatus Nitrospira allomarina]|uniref:AI-2E family transporter n=1 Tax=Candidatus Nitrospira allomarina TaxID=3020900 RepID=A0AA96JR00_9BACT|nr:AI-2E family transporter [Candidatus Nitrospira allomarina]WNM56593.1 AI-2E family transporter [Candidatus Nitrospira allomarina]
MPEIHKEETSELEREASAPSPSSELEAGYLSQLFQGPINIRSIALTGLFLYASLMVMYLAKAIMLPVFVALFLNLLFAPLVRGVEKIHIPAPLAAGGILLVFISVFTFGIVQLSTPASLWLDRAPEALQQVERKIRTIKSSVLEMGKATQALEHVASLSESRKAQRIEVKTDSLGGLLIGWTTEFILGLVSTMILLYFFLASGDLFLEKLVKVLPRFSDKRRAVEIVRGIENNISSYLVTVTSVNVGLALATSLAMYLLGMPNPFLWGAMAGILNFIPYVGSIIGLGAVTLAAAITFEHMNMVGLVFGTYLFLTAMEGNFITPHLLGRKLTLNPVIILVSVLFWGWLWGAVGALLAVPFVASLKIICDQIEPLNSIGEFLSR